MSTDVVGSLKDYFDQRFQWVLTAYGSESSFHLYQSGVSALMFAIATVAVDDGLLLISTGPHNGQRFWWEIELAAPDFFDRLDVAMDDLRTLKIQIQ